MVVKKNSHQLKNQMTCVDMFCGAGGLSCGLEMAGFRVLMASDIVPLYGRTYVFNHPDAVFTDKDIRQLTGTEVLHSTHLKRGELDLLAGGPPCQGFSINAPIRSLDDQRNHLFKEYLRIAEELRPKVILIENVPGIVSIGNGSVVAAIHKALQKIGYHADHRILFAAHYGVPQMRFRTFFIATRLDVPIEFPQPEYDASGRANFGKSKELCFEILPMFHGKLKKMTTVNDALSDLPVVDEGGVEMEMEYLYKPQNDYQAYLRCGSRVVFNHTANKLAQINHERLKHIPQGGSWRDIPHSILPKGLQRARRSDHTKRYGRLDPKGMCSTILTKCDPHWGSFFHPHQNRVLTVREAARIQSFPDKYRFLGSRTEQYTQVGNAVPPLLGRAVGKMIMRLIEGKTKGAAIA